jgi:hypothetical protein
VFERHFVECGHYVVEDRDWEGSIHFVAFAGNVDSLDVADGIDFLKALAIGESHAYLLPLILYL